MRLRWAGAAGRGGGPGRRAGEAGRGGGQTRGFGGCTYPERRAAQCDDALPRYVEEHLDELRQLCLGEAYGEVGVLDREARLAECAFKEHVALVLHDDRNTPMDERIEHLEDQIIGGWRMGCDKSGSMGRCFFSFF